MQHDFHFVNHRPVSGDKAGYALGLCHLVIDKSVPDLLGLAMDLRPIDGWLAKSGQVGCRLTNWSLDWSAGRAVGWLLADWETSGLDLSWLRCRLKASMLVASMLVASMLEASKLDIRRPR